MTPAAVVVDECIVAGRLQAFADRALEVFFEQEELCCSVSLGEQCGSSEGRTPGTSTTIGARSASVR